MERIPSKVLCLCANLATFVVAAPAVQADARCSDMSSHIPDPGQYVMVYLSMHREDPNWGVQYYEGSLHIEGQNSIYLSGGAKEYFSIRRTKDDQPFDPGGTEDISWTMDKDGVLHVHDNTWNFDLPPLHFTCVGNMMTVYRSGEGIYSLTFGDVIENVG